MCPSCVLAPLREIRGKTLRVSAKQQKKLSLTIITTSASYNILLKNLQKKGLKSLEKAKRGLLLHPHLSRSSLTD